MKIKFLSILVILFFSWSSSGYAEKKTILKIGTLQFPPYAYAQNGDQITAANPIAGYTTKLVIEVLKKMNVEYEFKIFPTARGHQMVHAGEIDVWTPMGRTPKREKTLHYPTENLTTYYFSFFIQKKDAGTLKFDKFEDLKGKRIGYVRGYYCPPDLKTYMEKNCKVRYVTTEEGNFRKLLNGHLDYVLSDYNIGRYFARKVYNEEDIVFLSNNFAMTCFAYPAFSKKTITREFVDKFSRTLEAFKKTEEHKKLFEREKIQLLNIDFSKATWPHLPY